ncbi:MAG: efflux RND transporter periplasmic adaptor subunit [Gammaproteobacteria bacterium]|nr:efflux RND transporter periplasmic adaptor subunit [Gammaproteobacteria bacterium]
MRIRSLTLILLCVLLAGTGAYYFLSLPVTVTVAQPLRGPAVEAVYATGNVEPVRWAKVGPKGTARIEQILAREGVQVTHGQVLARLNDVEARARVAQLSAQERLLQGEVKRLTPLLAKGYVGKQAYDRTVSDHTQAQASLAAAQQVVNDLSLRAPMDGIVLRQDGEPGETVTSTQVLFWVGETSPLRITAEVDEEDIPRVKTGQRVVIKADAFPGATPEGTVGDITPMGDPINKSYRVRISLPADTRLKIGMTTEVNIIVRETPQALLVPVDAVANGKSWRVRDGKATPVAVTTGALDEKRIEIVTGLSEQDAVIIAPPPGLKAGDKVRTQASSAP